MDKFLIEEDSYFDSVFLMLINSKIKEQEGIQEAVVAMGTGMNLKLLADMGMHEPRLEELGANDLIIAVRGEEEAAVDKAVAVAKEMLSKKEKGGEEQAYRPKTLSTAVQEYPDANLAIISLPGEFAGREARKALEKGLHVMLFSDNVPLEEEISLKELAVKNGLLMMGPDCGTAIINGAPLCFANVVRRGEIGLVGASGTGLQEVTCLIDDFGAGVSQAIGTGGRDLKNEKVGGRMMLQGIEALKEDASTKVLAVISKPPAPEMAEKVLGALRKTGKPAVVHFIGMDEASGAAGPAGSGGEKIVFAENLEQTAAFAAALSRGEAVRGQAPGGEADRGEADRGKSGRGGTGRGEQPKERRYSLPEAEVQELIRRETEGMGAQQKYLRGLFTGGTLADEALILLEKELGTVYSNNQSDPGLQLSDPHSSRGHSIIDLGDDIYTVGRAHPMIDPSTREERIRSEAEDPEMAVMMLDVVLGYGSHGDPAGAILDALREAKDAAAGRGGRISIVCSVTGTEGDFQGYRDAIRKLESVGCVVMPSNYQASLLALDILEAMKKKGGKR